MSFPLCIGLKISVVSRISPITHHVREVVDSWQAFVDDELERDSRQEQKERRLETVLRCTLLDSERQTRQTADRRLTYTSSSSSSCLRQLCPVVLFPRANIAFLSLPTNTARIFEGGSH